MIFPLLCCFYFSLSVFFFSGTSAKSSSECRARIFMCRTFGSIDAWKRTISEKMDDKMSRTTVISHEQLLCERALPFQRCPCSDDISMARFNVKFETVSRMRFNFSISLETSHACDHRVWKAVRMEITKFSPRKKTAAYTNTFRKESFLGEIEPFFSHISTVQAALIWQYNKFEIIYGKDFFISSQFHPRFRIPKQLRDNTQNMRKNRRWYWACQVGVVFRVHKT